MRRTSAARSTALAWLQAGKALVAAAIGAAGVGRGAFREPADDLLEVAGVDRVEVLGGGDGLAADPVLTLQGQPLLDLGERGPEGVGVRVDRKVGQGLVAEFRNHA